MKRSKKFLLFLLGAIMCLSLSVFAGCYFTSDDSDGDQVADITETTVTVTFDTNDGNEANQTTVDFGSTVTLPTPTRDGYNFMGWYYTYDSMEIEFTENIPVVADITLTAKWSKSHEFYLSYQTAAIVETGGYVICVFNYEATINDGYVTIEKDGTVYTEAEALEAGLISYSSLEVGSYYIYDAIYFAKSGDYTIHAYADGDTASTCVTVKGESVATFTADSVSFESIEHFGTTYTNGDEITYYPADSVYVYFNAPELSTARVTFTSNSKTYTANCSYSYAYGLYCVELDSAAIECGNEYTVKLTSLEYGTATATFTPVEATISGNTILTNAADIAVYEQGSIDEYYYVAASDVDSVKYTVTNTASGETSIDGRLYLYLEECTSGIYEINLWGYINAAGSYDVVITPYDSNGDAITDLIFTVNITVYEYVSPYWDIDTTAEGYDADYSEIFFTDETKTFTYVADSKMEKVILGGTDVPVGGSATLTVNGIPVTAECKISGGYTYLYITLSALEDDSALTLTDYVYLFLISADENGSNTYSEIVISILSSAYADYHTTIISAYKYSLDTYFADYITTGGELYDIYTAISAFPAAEDSSIKEIYAAACDIYMDIGYDIYYLSADVCDDSVDYQNIWYTKLDSKTSLCDTALLVYANTLGCYYVILDGSPVYDNLDMFYMGMSEYLLIETSDKEICDFIYDYYLDTAEFYADELGEIYTNLVEAHDNGTEAEYIAAINALVIALN